MELPSVVITRKDGSIYYPLEPEADLETLGGPNSGRYPKGSGKENQTFGDSPANAEDVAKFKALKIRWAQINNTILPHIDEPYHPEVQKHMAELKDIVKEIYTLDADAGGLAGIKIPGDPRDVVIIGGGPGGLNAAISAGTEGLDTLLIEGSDSFGGQAKRTSRIENLPGFPVGISGRSMAGRLLSQAERVGSETKSGVRVESIETDPETDLKTLTLSNGDKVVTRTVIIATGLATVKMDIPGAPPNKVVYDGETLVKESDGAPVVVIGGSNAAAQAALYAAHTNKVTMISRSPIVKNMSDYQDNQVHNHPNITLIEGDEIERMNPDGSVTTKKGQVVQGKAVGLFLGGDPKTEWMPQEIVKEIKKDVTARKGVKKVAVNPLTLETELSGVYAVGDIRHGSIGRVATAASDGSHAVRSVFDYFKRLSDRQKLINKGATR